MLSFLRISNLAIVEDVSIEPGPGLNVLTGETGAGKSIVVDAIGLLLGERGGAEMIRTGCDRMVVEAQFDLAGRDKAEDFLRQVDLEAGPDGELVIRRELMALGRGRAQVNGRIVTLAALRSLGEALADLHGQHQHQSLLRADGQRDALDRCAGTLQLRREVAESFALLSTLQREHDELAGRDRERARQEEMLRHQVNEIEAAAPRAGEEDHLRREESLLRHATEIARLASEAFGLISEDDDSVITRLGGVEERLVRLAAIDPSASEALGLAREAGAAASEIARGLSRYTGAEDLEPARLDHVAARLAELDRLKRKYGDSLEAVLAYHERASAELASLGGVEKRLEGLPHQIAAARASYLAVARELSVRRKRAAERLEKALVKELGALAMQETRVEIAVDSDASADCGPHGLDRIEFLLSPNKGEELRPLSRVASGGELSRLMLAVRNLTGAAGDERILIFDEVDSGIGGRTADAVGERLAALGRRQQVLCVTHLPQIASVADRHFVVSKETSDGRTRASVVRLEGARRVEELARMLGGEPRQTARRHAAALMGRRGRVQT